MFFTKVSFQKILKYNYKIFIIDTIYKINKYKIFLIIINRITLLNISYYVVFIFVSKKTNKVYKWSLKFVKDFYKYFNISDLNVILTNI